MASPSSSLNVPNPRKRNPSTTLPTETSPIYSPEAISPKDYSTMSPDLRASDSQQQNVSNTHTTSVESAAGAAATAAPEAEDHKPLDRTASAQRVAAAVERGEKSAWSGFWEKYGSVELDNKGSVARDHLALGMSFPYTPTNLPTPHSPLPTICYLSTIRRRSPPFPSHPSTQDPAPKTDTPHPHRTHLPCLAPYIPLLRLHRHSSNPALST